MKEGFMLLSAAMADWRVTFTSNRSVCSLPGAWLILAETAPLTMVYSTYLPSYGCVAIQNALLIVSKLLGASHFSPFLEPPQKATSSSVVSVYHPSGTSGDERQAFKMVWLEDFQKYVMELQKSRPNLILCGDYNICHEPIDIHDPVRNATNSGFLPEEREWMTRFLSAGYVDSFRTLCPEKQEYTWWSYRFNSRAKNKGWRIDYCMVSEPVRPLLKRAYILNEAVHSDHCPMALEIL